LIVVLAPGNIIRLQHETKAWGMNRADSLSEWLLAGFNTMSWAGIISMQWLLTQPYHYFIVLLALVLAMDLPKHVQNFLDRKRLLWLPIIMLALICIAALPSFYLGRKPPPRTVASIYIVFWLSYIPSFVILMRNYKWGIHGKGLKKILKIALIVSMVLSPRYLQAMYDVKNAVIYKIQLYERENIVNSAIEEGLRDVLVPKLVRIPSTIHYRDLEDENIRPNMEYINRCYASYRGLKSIATRGEGDTVRIVQELKAMIGSLIDRVIP
jgi:hypothetical protein